MSNDPTIQQENPEQLRSRELSMQRGAPPAQVPGYEFERFLGGGAYGEVWVAVERNTGRRVAIKFYAHRGGLDWSLLSREVEKLAFLFADRYVVQLIGVGWDADPPYYIMEYLERGSLAEQLQQGPMPVDKAVELFREVAIGLAHAHGKGVLHCDLKPANILLDQDGRPRLADFGQSRLSHEQAPALGTLFYMAPEQADLSALPEARWDVYALGALLYCMLTGNPPYREDHQIAELEHGGDLDQRLAHYRKLIRKLPLPAAHRKVPGVDRELATIIDNCLVVQPHKRYPNVQAVLDALRQRAVRRARRPMILLGAALPVLLLLVVSGFGWWGFSEVLRQTDDALTRRALESNRFAARYVARAAGNELDARWRTIEQMAYSGRLQPLLKECLSDKELSGLLARISDPHATPDALEEAKNQFLKHAKRQKFQSDFAAAINSRSRPRVTVWTLNDARGVQIARYPEVGERPTIGRNFAWRTYFSGEDIDMPPDWRPKPGQHVKDTFLSPVFYGQGANRWLVAVASPVFDEDDETVFLGVVTLIMEVGRLIELQGSDQQFAVLVDWREGENKGVVLQHPLLDDLLARNGTVPDRFRDYRMTHNELPASPARSKHYEDPLAQDVNGQVYRKHWLAQMEPVWLRGQNTGWLVIIQESYDTAIGASLGQLRSAMIRYGAAAIGSVLLLIIGLWYMAIRMLGQVRARGRGPRGRRATETGSGGTNGATATDTSSGASVDQSQPPSTSHPADSVTPESAS